MVVVVVVLLSVEVVVVEVVPLCPEALELCAKPMEAIRATANVAVRNFFTSSP